MNCNFVDEAKERKLDESLMRFAEAVVDNSETVVVQLMVIAEDKELAGEFDQLFEKIHAALKPDEKGFALPLHGVFTAWAVLAQLVQWGHDLACEAVKDCTGQRKREKLEALIGKLGRWGAKHYEMLEVKKQAA